MQQCLNYAEDTLLHSLRCRSQLCFLGLTSSERFAFLTATHDKAAHFTVFLVESWLFARMFAHRELQVWPLRQTSALPEEIDLETGDVQPPANWRIDKYVLGAIVCIGIAAVGSEFAQHVLTHGKRSFDYRDMLCNALGSSTGLLIAYWGERR